MANYRKENPLVAGDASKRWRRAHPERYAKVNHNIKLKKYGISPEEYDRLFTTQDGRCAICRNPETVIIKGTLAKLSIDHNHATNEVRGLLCRHCNQGLGLFRDSPELLRVAVQYLERPAILPGLKVVADETTVLLEQTG